MPPLCPRSFCPRSSSSSRVISQPGRAGRIAENRLQPRANKIRLRSGSPRQEVAFPSGKWPARGFLNPAWMAAGQTAFIYLSFSLTLRSFHCRSIVHRVHGHRARGDARGNAHANKIPSGFPRKGTNVRLKSAVTAWLTKNCTKLLVS